MHQQQQRWREVDFYAVLGVSSTATAAEIKTQYRKESLIHSPISRLQTLLVQFSHQLGEELVSANTFLLALRAHPDKEGGDAERFKALAEAYGVISDEQSRRHYDLVRLSEERMKRNAQRNGADGNRTDEDDFEEFVADPNLQDMPWSTPNPSVRRFLRSLLLIAIITLLLSLISVAVSLPIVSVLSSIGHVVYLIYRHGKNIGPVRLFLLAMVELITSLIMTTFIPRGLLEIAAQSLPVFVAVGAASLRAHFFDLSFGLAACALLSNRLLQIFSLLPSPPGLIWALIAANSIIVDAVTIFFLLLEDKALRTFVQRPAVKSYLLQYWASIPRSYQTKIYLLCVGPGLVGITVILTVWQVARSVLARIRQWTLEGEDVRAQFASQNYQAMPNVNHQRKRK